LQSTFFIYHERLYQIYLSVDRPVICFISSIHSDNSETIFTCEGFSR